MTPIEFPVFINDDEFDRQEMGMPDKNLAESGVTKPFIFFTVDAVAPYENYGSVFTEVMANGEVFITSIPWDDVADVVVAISGQPEIYTFNTNKYAKQ